MSSVRSQNVRSRTFDTKVSSLPIQSQVDDGLSWQSAAASRDEVNQELVDKGAMPEQVAKVGSRV